MSITKFNCHSGIFVGLRVDGTPRGYTYMINNSKASIILVENSKQVHKILQVGVSSYSYVSQRYSDDYTNFSNQVLENLTHLKAIVQFKGKLVHKCDCLYHVSEKSISNMYDNMYLIHSGQNSLILARK